MKNIISEINVTFFSFCNFITKLYQNTNSILFICKKLLFRPSVTNTATTFLQVCDTYALYYS